MTPSALAEPFNKAMDADGAPWLNTPSSARVIAGRYTVFEPEERN
jgi:hypothetical protein